MMLLIDAGNTRIKWASLGSEGLGVQQADSYGEWDSGLLRNRILGPAGRVDRVLVSNVGGQRIATLLDDAIRSEWGIAPEFIRATAAAGGVRNAYSSPEKLGTDRWCALIACHSIQQHAACVIGVGTAMTIDGVTADGQHLGGVIVPGPDLMISSLMRNTSDIAIRAQDGRIGDGLFADNTLGAVYQGALHALSALVERAVAMMRQQLGHDPLVVITGGAADRVARILEQPALDVPDLVLRGLAVLAATSARIPEPA